MYHFGTFIYLCLFYSTTVHYIRCALYDEIYQNMNAFYPCVYYSGVKGGIGCFSSRNGNKGRLYLVDNSDHLKSLFSNKVLDDVIVLLDESLFNLGNIEALEKLKTLKGIIVKSSILATESINGTSPASKCPSESPYELKCNHTKWNPYGENLLYRKFNYPIFLVDNPDEIIKIKNCLSITEHSKNGNISKCGVEIKSFMYSKDQTSKICLKRSEKIFILDDYCEYLYGMSYWASLGDYLKDFKDSEKVIVLSAILDGRSLFYGKDTNAESSAIGLITLLSTVHILGQWKRNNNIISKMKDNVIVLLNNKETFEFTGSKVLSFYLNDNSIRFPSSTNFSALSLKNISTFIEFNQLGLIKNTENPLFLHSNHLESNTKLNVIIDTLLEHGINAKPSQLNTIPNRDMPPCSFNAFYEKNPKIDGIILTDFDTEFKNKRYLSHRDDANYLNIQYTKSGILYDKDIIMKLENVSIAMAKAILKLSKVPDDVISSLHPPSKLMVETLISCVLSNYKCSSFQVLYKSFTNYDDGPLVRSPDSDHHVILKRLLAYFLGNLKEIDSKQKCKQFSEFNDENYYSFETDNRCIFRASVYNINTNYDDPENSQNFHLWTISGHDSYTLRLYVIPSSVDKYLTFFLGIISTLSTIFLGMYLTRLYNSNILISPSVINNN